MPNLAVAHDDPLSHTAGCCLCQEEECDKEARLMRRLAAASEYIRMFGIGVTAVLVGDVRPGDPSAGLPFMSRAARAWFKYAGPVLIVTWFCLGVWHIWL